MDYGKMGRELTRAKFQGGASGLDRRLVVGTTDDRIPRMEADISQLRLELKALQLVVEKYIPRSGRRRQSE